MNIWPLSGLHDFWGWKSNSGVNRMIYNQNMIVYSIHNSWAVVFLGVFDYFQLFSVKTAKIGCYDRSVLFLKKKLNFFFKKTLTSLDTFALRYFAEIYPKNFIGPNFQTTPTIVIFWPKNRLNSPRISNLMPKVMQSRKRPNIHKYGYIDLMRPSKKTLGPLRRLNLCQNACCVSQSKP